MYENSRLTSSGFTPEVAARIERSKADNFAYSQQGEALLAMKANDPAAFDSLSPALKTTTAYYSASKAAAKAHGIDVTGGAK
ncbi:hypothetical protein [Streptomyces altiplanensis]